MGPVIPEPHFLIKATNNDCVAGEFQEIRLFLHFQFGPFSLGDIEMNADDATAFIFVIECNARADLHIPQCIVAPQDPNQAGSQGCP